MYAYIYIYVHIHININIYVYVYTYIYCNVFIFYKFYTCGKPICYCIPAYPETTRTMCSNK